MYMKTATHFRILNNSPDICQAVAVLMLSGVFQVGEISCQKRHQSKN